MKIFLVDAFASHPFSGNAAGVLLSEQRLAEGWMQAVAGEMNQAETAFPIPIGQNRFELRWFTPTVEVDLCGHATLATAHVLFETGTADPDATIAFETKSGELTCSRRNGLIAMDFPSEPVEPTSAPTGTWPAGEWFRNRMDWLMMLESEDVVRKFEPKFDQILAIGLRGLIVTAVADAGRDYHFVSRFFAPQSGVPEDAVTGSAHCALSPFWSSRLGHDELIGFQASRRGGLVHVRYGGHRVELAGEAQTTLQGDLSVEPVYA